MSDIWRDRGGGSDGACWCIMVAEGNGEERCRLPATTSFTYPQSPLPWWQSFLNVRSPRLWGGRDSQQSYYIQVGPSRAVLPMLAIIYAQSVSPMHSRLGNTGSLPNNVETGCGGSGALRTFFEGFV